ncbi:ATPase [Thioclava sp. SK-1]|uniref:ATP12 family chaperone protein n=1 Tax=Thioclava sp. SK-1 TaxID=1889770 RepID=UPI0008249285|nr:ATP12 family protein [Thioclava sp. SK-1]OCX58656.1 ATPase [Thioclava sp. SK-1]
MSGWVAKRFWKQAHSTEVEGGFSVALDGRPVRTPAKAALIVPSRALADAIAQEWDAQLEVIDPTTMPMTRSANAAIDKVATQHAEVAAYIAEYGGTDLLCYRAESPVELVDRQAQAWDPLLDWADHALGVQLVVTEGVLPVQQADDAMKKLHKRVADLSPFQMAAIHDLVGITGSLVIGLAVIERRLDASTAWDLSRIDEDWQSESWGHDEEAAEMAAIKRESLLNAERFWDLCHS